MLAGFVVATAVVTILVGAILAFRAKHLTGTTAGRLTMLLGIGILPLVGLAGGTVHAVKQSSTTDFCLKCHEMEDYGRSLFLDDQSVLPAVHYQKRLIDRQQTCFACHTDYAMFGDVKAKVAGLQHVWVHYLGEVPEPGEMELYQPYPNYNCLHCHEDARGYTESAPHKDMLESLRKGRDSCLKCHGKGHALDQVEAGAFWMN